MMQILRDMLLQDSLAAVLLLSLVKATLVLALAQLLTAALPRLSASMRHLILTAALSAFVVIPVVGLIGPDWRIPVGTATQEVGAPIAPADTNSAATSTTAPGVTPPTGDPTVARAFASLTPARIAVLVWLAVCLFLIARLALSAARVRGIVREAAIPSPRIAALFDDVRGRLGIDSSVRILRSERIAVPMAWGLRRGTLLLPAISDEWSDEELRATLIHELAHLQRLDYFSLTLMNLVSALLWFHPQIWRARQRALAEGERACDDLVVRAGERASGYASHLLSVARLMPKRDPLTALLAMSRPSQLEGRMYALLSTSVNRQPIGRKPLMSVLTIFLAAIIPLSAMQFTLDAAVDAPPGFLEVAVAAAPEGSSASHSLVHTSSISGRTGTCADYQSSFGGAEIALSEQRLDVAGSRLAVTASRNGGVSLHRSTNGAFSVIACNAAGGDDMAEANATLSRISTQERNGAVTVNGPEEGRWVVHLIVSVPDGASVAARAQNGPLSVQGLDATVRAEVQNGPLSLSNSRGEITASAVNGPLSLTGMSGNIDASVQNGPLTVVLGDGGWVGGELRASVGNGPLQLEVPEGYGSGVVVKTTGHGPFACSLPECPRLEVSSDHRGPWRPREVNLGSGMDSVFIQGGNGPVTISRPE